jgi:NAD kinase
MADQKIILIVRNTRLDELISRHNTRSQAKFYVEHLGADFLDYEREHSQYQDAVAQASDSLSTLGRLQVLHRTYLPNFLFGDSDTVVVLGQDGLVANTLKYLDRQPVLGVNPDPARWEGVLLPFTVKDLAHVIPEVFEGKRKITPITMAKASLKNSQVLYGVNDIFIGPKSHTSLRYSIRSAEREETQSSSGIIVSTGLGSTGWLKSVLVGAKGIVQSQIAKQSIPQKYSGFAWDSRYLYYSVREPFPSKTSRASILFGKITEDCPLYLISATPDTGVIFSDGIESDFLQFPSGMEVTISVADRVGRLVQ